MHLSARVLLTTCPIGTLNPFHRLQNKRTHVSAAVTRGYADVEFEEDEAPTQNFVQLTGTKLGAFGAFCCVLQRILLNVFVVLIVCGHGHIDGRCGRVQGSRGQRRIHPRQLKFQPGAILVVW